MMEKFQEYIEQNLPDRFRRLKVFRIPVNCDGINYWASYNNGVWKFDPGSNTSTPIITYTSTFTESAKEDGVAISDVENDNVLSIPESNPAIPAEPIKKGKKDKPVKEKKERPVKEKKERPVKEKKERPVKENRKDVQNSDVIDTGFGYDEFEQSMIPTYCKFTEKCIMKKRKKLTGRIILAVLNLITGGLITGFGSVSTACSANSNIDNPIDYWHYRKVNSVWHTFVLLRLLTIITVVVAFVVAAMVMGTAVLSFTPLF